VAYAVRRSKNEKQDGAYWRPLGSRLNHESWKNNMQNMRMTECSPNEDEDSQMNVSNYRPAVVARPTNGANAKTQFPTALEAGMLQRMTSDTASTRFQRAFKIEIHSHQTRDIASTWFPKASEAEIPRQTRGTASRLRSKVKRMLL
jgi:hypothetical protein